ncbi:MAG: hypothetical protein JXL84_08220 [Deltaproteobacteria bacterium]|nr:hypothetical protein [Deltaproteobacteria bacterium]
MGEDPIFAVRANYMAQFREYLEKEGVETDGVVELPLFIRPNRKFLKERLLVPRAPEGCNFAAETNILLDPDPAVHVHVDMSLKVQALESDSNGVLAIEARAGRERSIPAKSLDLVDWEQVYLDLLEYKERRGLTNLVICPDVPRRILATSEPGRLYSLVADESVVRPQSFADTALLKEAVVNILRKYTDSFYRTNRERWDSKHMVYRTLDEKDPNLSFNRAYVKEKESSRYVVKIQRSESALVASIKKLIREVDRIYREEAGKLPRIYFDRHLYQPLLLEHAEKVTITPPGLKKSEFQFVQDMKSYWAKEKDKSLSNAKVFLLRNLSHGKGIGFFEERYFYPDFILWIVVGKRQHIVFVEPHGMLHANSYAHDDKARLHEALPDLAKGIGVRSKRKDVTLDSFIVSATPYQVLRKKYDDGKWDREKFASAHILFLERSEEYDYMERIFTSQREGHGA